MLLYVDLEHPRLADTDPKGWRRTLRRRLKVKYFLEDITGDECLLVRYHKFTPELVASLQTRAVVVSGNTTEFEFYSDTDLAGLRAVYLESALPILAFCGGFQLLAQAHGADIGPMEPWQLDDPRPTADFLVSPNRRQETGFQQVRTKQDDPLFQGLPRQITVFQAHYWEVKAPPPGFEVVAESDLCPIQALRSTSLPIFGTQFHPEVFDSEHSHGRQILRNFFRWAAV